MTNAFGIGILIIYIAILIVIGAYGAKGNPENP